MTHFIQYRIIETSVISFTFHNNAQRMSLQWMAGLPGIARCSLISCFIVRQVSGSRDTYSSLLGLSLAVFVVSADLMTSLTTDSSPNRLQSALLGVCGRLALTLPSSRASASSSHKHYQLSTTDNTQYYLIIEPNRVLKLYDYFT